MIIRLMVFAALTAVFCMASPHGLAQAPSTNLAAKVDEYVDSRFDAPPQATERLLKQLAASGYAEMEQLEALLRAPRSKYPDHRELVGKTTSHDVECYHVDYQSKFLMFVPASYDASRPSSLVIVGHGGNSSMSPQRAEMTARMYLDAYAPSVSKHMNAIVVAPVSSRGWGHIGNSLILTTIANVQRMLNIDPDRIYIRANQWAVISAIGPRCRCQIGGAPFHHTAVVTTMSRIKPSGT